MRNIAHSLAFRLFCLLLLVSAIVFITLTTLIIRANTQHVMEEITLSAQRTNELLLRSMRQSMLLNRLNDVAQTINTLGAGPGVEGIRIYGKPGSVVFSTSTSEIGRKVNTKAAQCIVCHLSEKPLQFIPEAVRSRIFSSQDGYRVLGVLKSVRNEPACAAPSCHPPPSEKKILGVLDSHFSLEQVDRNILASRNLMILYSIGAILAIEFFAGLFIMLMVHKRVVKACGGTARGQKGQSGFQHPGGRQRRNSRSGAFVQQHGNKPETGGR